MILEISNSDMSDIQEILQREIKGITCDEGLENSRFILGQQFNGARNRCQSE